MSKIADESKTLADCSGNLGTFCFVNLKW